MPSRWSKDEVEYLHNHASDGADEIAKALGRSKSSVKHQAHHYGISLRRLYVCPNCQQVTTKWLSPVTGWCPACSIDVSRAKAEAKNRKLEAEIKAEEERIKRARRKRQMVYSDNTRKKWRLDELRNLNGTQESEEK